MSPDPSRFYTLSLHDALPISSLRVLMKLSSHLEALSPARSNASPQFSMPLVPIPLDQKPFASSQILGSRTVFSTSPSASLRSWTILLVISSAERDPVSSTEIGRAHV